MGVLQGYVPHTQEQLNGYYLIVCILYMTVHLIWDARSRRTPPFSLYRLYLKSREVYSSANFSTSLFLMMLLLDLNNPLRTSEAMMLPLLLAALTGLMLSLSALVPEKIHG